MILGLESELEAVHGFLLGGFLSYVTFHALFLAALRQFDLTPTGVSTTFRHHSNRKPPGSNRRK